MTHSQDPLRYPIGEFEAPPEVTNQAIQSWIADIKFLPEDLRKTVEPLTPKQLDTPYRPGGWNVRQVVHHMSDSHLNSFIRFKWALTEDRPVIKAFFEDRWAELPDYSLVPVGVSLDLLEALHTRWVALLGSLSQRDLDREFVHPELGPVRLSVNISLYAWHGKHHLAHIQTAIQNSAQT